MSRTALHITLLTIRSSLLFSIWTSDTKFEIEKYTFFDKAVFPCSRLIGFRPDIIHCHDWQAGLLPVYLKNEFAADPFFWGIKSIITIHNLKFQGIWDREWVQGSFRSYRQSVHT